MLAQSFLLLLIRHGQQCYSLTSSVGLKKNWTSNKLLPGIGRRIPSKGILARPFDWENFKVTHTPLFHHTAIRTRDIDLAIKFYSLFGFQVEEKFRAGPARAAWLTSNNNNHSSFEDTKLNSSRLELIEIPSYILQETEGTRKRAMDAFQSECLLGLNHVALDVTATIAVMESEDVFADDNTSIGHRLRKYIDHVNDKSIETFGKSLRVAMKPRQQIIGKRVYEMAFLYDADGTIVELLNLIQILDHVVESGWEPWDGKGFV